MTDVASRNIGNPVVRLKGVVKSYQGGDTANRVLDGIDLRIERGCSAFLAGPSGSGKTTLLSILGCILSADAGDIEILGCDISRLNAQERTFLRRDRIGFVFQRFHLIRGLSAGENVGVPLVLRGIDPRVIRERSAALLEMVGLADKFNFHAEQLSVGQCQRVALARALANDPDLILADEPTASLDATNGHNIMELLWRLTVQEDRTMIVVTHDQRIFSFADHVYWLNNGQIVDRSEPAAGKQPLPPSGTIVNMPSFPGGFPTLAGSEGQ